MKTVSFEGGDKVGKHTSVLATTKTLLLSEQEVIFMDLPQYWNLGGLIHKFLRMESLDSISPEREIELRCVMYALDRITVLPHIEALTNKAKDSIVVSDRGYPCNAVTLGFARSLGKITEEEVPNLVDKFTYWDRQYIKELNPSPILLSVGDEGKSAHELGLQEREDVYETVDAQVEAVRIYKEYLKLPEVNTQENGKWRSTLSIVKDVLNKANIFFDKNLTQKDLDNLNTENILRNKSFSIIGPQLVYPIIYGKEWNDIKSRFENLLDDWSRAVIDGNKADLRIIEPELARLSLEYIPKDIYFEIPEDIRQWFKTTFNEFPEIKYIVSKLCGEEYWKYLEKFAA